MTSSKVAPITGITGRDGCYLAELLLGKGHITCGIKLRESDSRLYGRDYRSGMPSNVYGPGDNYHPENSHIVPALPRRFHEDRLAYDPRPARDLGVRYPAIGR